MSTAIIEDEPELTSGNLSDADSMLIADNSAGGAPKSALLATLRDFLASSLVAATAATLTVTRAAHAGRTITLGRAAGIAVTLPAATGSGSIYRFVVSITFTSDGTIKVVGDDTMIGTALLLTDTAAVMAGFAAAGTDDTITMDGADTGGILGCEIVLTDIAADLWHVAMTSDATGTEATPFSATVS